MSGQHRTWRAAAAPLLAVMIVASTIAWPAAPPTVSAMAPAAAGTAPVTVELTSAGFVPETITAAVGQTVWIDNASAGTRTVTVGGGSLASGPIPVGGRFVFALPTSGSFAVTDDAATANTATLNVGESALSGAGSSLAATQFPNLVPPPAPLDLHPEFAFSFTRNRIILTTTFNATVSQLNTALADNGLVIVGGINPGGSGSLQYLVTEVVGGASPSDTVALQAILDDLRARSTVIRAAALDIALTNTEALPRPISPAVSVSGPESYSVWDALVATDGSARGFGRNYGLESARFPQAWNLRDEARRRSPNGPAWDTVVIDQGFDVSHPDVASATPHSLCTPGNAACTTSPIDSQTGRPISRHGNSVAGTIGAPFERGPAGSRTFRGIVGGNPEADLHLVAWSPDLGVADSTSLVSFFNFAQTIGLVLTARPTLFNPMKVVNISGHGIAVNVAAWDAAWGGAQCGPGFGDDADATAPRVACTPNTLDSYLREFRFFAELSRLVAESMNVTNTVLVISAGNESTRYCVDRPLPTTTACSNYERIRSINTHPLAWVDHTWPSSSNRTSPILMAEAYDESNRIASYSNIGTLSAPGSVVGLEILPLGSPTYSDIQGTSFAAPLISAAAGLIAAVSSTTQNDVIVRHLKQRGRTDIAGTLTPRLDVFEAVMSLPGVAARLVDVNDPSPDGNRRTFRNDDGSVFRDDVTRAASTTGPLWSSPDGLVDLRDFRVFRDAWLYGCKQGDIVSASCPPAAAIVLDGAPFHPKHDTNLDGCIRGDGLAECDRPETLFSRLDFNGDGRLDDTRVVVPLTATGAVAPLGEGRLMSDLEVLASQWGRGVGADTGGYGADELGRLLSSADVEIRFGDLWAQGATSAVVEAVSIATLDELWQETVTKPTSPFEVPWKVITLPVWPIAEPSLVQLRVTATIPGRSEPAVFMTPLLDARPGEDLTVVPCADQLTITANPVTPEPGGTSRIEARLVDCLGNPVVGEELTFDLRDALNGSLLGGEVFVDGIVDPAVTFVTDADGRARVDFTFPVREIAPSAVRVTAYPGIGALTPLRATVAIGAAYDIEPGLTVFYRSREVIEEYERFSTNEWDDEADDCDGPIDATGSPYGCFASRQRLGFPDSIDIDAGVIMIDRRGRVEVEDQVAFDELRVLGGLEADEYDPSVHYGFVPLVTNVLEWPAGNLAAVTDREIFSSIDITTPGSPSYEWSGEYPILLPDVTYTLNAFGLDVFGLAAVNDSTYWQATTHSASGFYPTLHPDVPVGQYQYYGTGHRHQIPTELAVLNRIDGSSFPFAGNVDGPLTVRRSPDGSFLTYTYCARNDRSIDSGGGYWNDDDPLQPWGRNPDDQRFERQDGDRAAPKHSGVIRSKSIFVAHVSLDGSPPPEGALDLPACDPPGGDASFTVSANPQEGRVVRFTPTARRFAGDDRLEYLWTFGDGGTSTERVPEHVYDDSGEYIVTLTVTDPEGGVGVDAKQISVANTPPNLWIEAARTTGTGLEFDIRLGEFSGIDGLGITVVVTGTSVTGSTGFPVVPATPYPIGTHTIAVNGVQPGTYNVTIFAIDKDGGSASRTLQLTVTANPTPEPTIQPLMSPATVGEEPAPQPLGLRSSMSTATASAVTGAASGDPLATVAIPAFVLSSLDTTTDSTVQIRNASISNGAPVGTVFDLGDGRTGVPITAGATTSISYLAAGDFVVRTALAGVSAGSPLTVTGAPVVPVVTYLGSTTGFVGQEVEVSARVTATIATGTPVAGRPVSFSVPGASVTAVTGNDGVAATKLRLPAPAGAITLAVDVPAAGDDSGTSTTAAFVVQANEPPTVDAGGPYTVPIDDVLSLQASGTDPDDGPTALGFAWDLDGDGDFDDAIGSSAALTNQQLTALVCGGACTNGQAYPIAVRATDPKGATAVDTTTVTPISDFALTITPATATLVPNSQTSFTVNVVTTNGFDQPVTLSAPSLPPDVTASFSPATVTPNGSSVLTLRAGAAAQAATAPLVVRGTSGGIVRETGGSVSLEFGLLPVCYGTITGVVRASDTGEPLAGFPVSISSISRSTTTDDEGRYRFEQLPVAADNGPRFYELRFNGVGFETRFVSGIVAACNVVTTFDADVVRIRYGTITGRVFLADAVGAIIGPLANVAVTGPSGPATDAEGRYIKQNVALNPGATPRNYSVGVNGVANVRHPALGVIVNVRADEVTEQDLVSYQICFGSVRGRMIDEATKLPIPFARMSIGNRTIVADAQGVAIMNDIPLGAPDNARLSLSVTGRPPTGTTIFRPGTGAVLPRCGAITPVDVPVIMPVENFATIAATIVDAETGEPVEGLTLGTAGGARSPEASNAQGRVDWRVSLGLNNTTGNISVFAVAGNGYYSSATQNLALTANGTREATFQVLRARTGSVEGRVTDAVTGAPLPAITVTMGFRTTSTDADGRYRFDGVGLQAGNLPTQVQLTARDNVSWWLDPIAYWNRSTTVTVEADQTSTADFAMVPICQGANVRGRVINAATGEPLEGALVGTGFDSRLTDAEGRFSFTDIRVAEQNAPRSIWMSASKEGFTSASRQVTLFCGADIIVDFGAADANVGTISGQVTDEDGTPIPDVFVGTEFGGAAVTGADGRYTISSVPVNGDGTPRDWQVTFIPPLASGFSSATRTATVSTGVTATVDAVLVRGTSAPNQSPTARITGPSTAAEGSTVTLSAATSSDPDGTIVLYEWDLGADGTFEVSGADATTFDVTLPDDGTVTVRLRVTDDEGATGTTTATITFTNVAPTVDFTSDPVVDGVTVTRNGSFADPGTADTHTATVDWGDGSGPEPLALTGTTFTLDHVYAATGTYTITVEVCDDDASTTVDGCGSAAFDVSVTMPNRPPTAAPSSVATRLERPVAITLSGTDPDGDDLTFAVVDPPERGVLTGTAPDLVYTPDDGYIGDDQFTFTVSDGELTSEPATVSIRVTEANVAPTATVSGPTTAAEGSTVTLSAAGSVDPDGSIVAVEWDLGDDGSVDGTSTTFDVTSPDDAVVTVRLTVTDDEGATGTTTATVTFTNVAPTVTLSGDLAVGSDRRVTRSGSFTDPGTADTHTATVDWGEGTGPEMLVLTGTTFALDHTYAEPGTYTVVVEVCDDDASDTVDGCGSAQFTATIAPPRVNVAPTAVVTGALTALEGSTVSLSGTSSTDPDGSIVLYEWDLDGDGTFERTGPTTSVSLPDQGDVTVTLRVTDDDGATHTTTRTITFTDVPPLIVLANDLRDRFGRLGVEIGAAGGPGRERPAPGHGRLGRRFGSTPGHRDEPAVLTRAPIHPDRRHARFLARTFDAVARVVRILELSGDRDGVRRVPSHGVHQHVVRGDTALGHTHRRSRGDRRRTEPRRGRCPDHAHRHGDQRRTLARQRGAPRDHASAGDHGNQHHHVGVGMHGEQQRHQLRPVRRRSGRGQLGPPAADRGDRRRTRSARLRHQDHLDHIGPRVVEQPCISQLAHRHRAHTDRPTCGAADHDDASRRAAARRKRRPHRGQVGSDGGSPRIAAAGRQRSQTTVRQLDLSERPAGRSGGRRPGSGDGQPGHREVGHVDVGLGGRDLDRAGFGRGGRPPLPDRVEFVRQLCFEPFEILQHANDLVLGGLRALLRGARSAPAPGSGAGRPEDRSDSCTT
jgi:PKD repeat protein